MNQSILLSVKKMLGLDANYTWFDQDIIMHINSVFLTISQIGIGPEEPYQISGSQETWTDFANLCEYPINALTSYMYLKVRMLFDPPTSSFILDSYKNLAQELEWRMNLYVETRKSEV